MKTKEVAFSSSRNPSRVTSQNRSAFYAKVCSIVLGEYSFVCVLCLTASNFPFTLQFYFYILAVSSALLCVYILCNLYNLVWIVCPQLGTMYRIICRYQEHVGESEANLSGGPSSGGGSTSKNSNWSPD